MNGLGVKRSRLGLALLRATDLAELGFSLRFGVRYPYLFILEARLRLQQLSLGSSFSGKGRSARGQVITGKTS